MGSEQFKLTLDQIDYAVSVDDIQRLDGGGWGRKVIGQPRALEALEMGTSIRAKGYNVFVNGAAGTGRRTAVMQVLSDFKPDNVKLRDLAYVYDFHAALSPKALSLPAGQGKLFRKDLHSFVENIKKLVAMQTDSADFKKQKDELVTNWDQEENSRLAKFEAALAADGFQVVQVQGDEGQSATDILPLRDGATLSFDDLQARVEAGKSSQADFESTRERYYRHMDAMRLIFVDLKRGRSTMEDKLDVLRKKTLRPLVHSEIEILAARCEDEKLRSWIKELERDLLGHLFLFAETGAPPADQHSAKVPLSRYGINILTNNGDVTIPPVIFEAHPTYANLFGSIEQHNETPGDSRSAYLKVRPGSIIRASGGFLVLQAEDLIQEEESWIALKRVLRTGKVEIQPQPGPFGPPPAAKPEALEVDIKVILIGGEMLYDMLYQGDPDFQKLFKISAEFDATMNRNDESIKEYVSFIRKITREEHLRDPAPDGIAAAIEHGVRLSDHKNRLTTRFSQIADLLREADYRAAKGGRSAIDAQAVEEALHARSWLSNMQEEKLADMIVAGEIILKVSGTCVGRLNGLAVHDRGYYAFGMPAVISAQVSPGESGVINIEGESGLSGEIYNKAVLIVEGFMRSRYARDFPLAVSASICFEQSYTGVEGDSASSTAVYALLSAIANVPLRQDIAVTGSVNQMGQIQPVGGVTEKIEGFYHICKKAGFTGTQGVMIPRQNVVNLTLSREVMNAIREGRFSVYAVATIDEGIEVLTGIKPGNADEQGKFEPTSFNALVGDELRTMAKTIKEYLN